MVGCPLRALDVCSAPELPGNSHQTIAHEEDPCINTVRLCGRSSYISSAHRSRGITCGGFICVEPKGFACRSADIVEMASFVRTVPAISPKALLAATQKPSTFVGASSPVASSSTRPTVPTTCTHPQQSGFMHAQTNYSEHPCLSAVQTSPIPHSGSYMRDRCLP